MKTIEMKYKANQADENPAVNQGAFFNAEEDFGTALGLFLVNVSNHAELNKTVVLDALNDAVYQHL